MGTTAGQLEAKKLSALGTAMDAASAAAVSAHIDALFDSGVREVGDVIRAALIPARGGKLVARAS